MISNEFRNWSGLEFYVCGKRRKEVPISERYKGNLDLCILGEDLCILGEMLIALCIKNTSF